jgi:PAS domain S-box-containing protein
MVNPLPDDLAAVRDRALRATDVSFVLTAAAPGSPVVWVNDAFTATTGWTLEEILGRRPSVLHGPGTDPAAARRMAEAVAAGRRATETILNYRKDGTPFWNQVSLAPVADDDGVVRHWVGIQVDVTDRVEHAGGLERSVQQERRARRGLAVVAHVSQLLGDVEDAHLLREIARLLEQDVVELAAYFLDEGGLREVEGISAAVAESTSTRRHRRGRPADDAPRTTPDLVQHLLEGALEGPVEVRLDTDPAGETTSWLVERVRERLGHRDGAVAVVHAIPGRRRNLGLQVVVLHGGRGLDDLEDHESLVLPLVARRIGTVTDNVRLYAREHRLAETLQRAMLPQQADVRDLDVWTYYAPSSGHAQVGGDWYDVLEPEAGTVALVVGDVVGHDVEAAAAMGQLRSVVRSYVFGDPEPAEVLRRVDQLVAGMHVPRPASLVLVTLQRDPDGTGWGATYSRAGHLPPLVVRDGKVLRLDGARGPMLGFGTGERSAEGVRLAPGDVLVLYTDGLIERRDRRLRDGLDALVETAADFGRQDAAGVGEELLSRLADSPEDDVAVVVVRIPDPGADGPGDGASARSRRWTLPGEPASIGRARQAVLRTCAAWGIPGGSSAELVVSELVANAVLHGWGHLQLRLYDTGDGLRIEVEDANPAPPVTTDGHPGRIGGYGMRIVERLADWGWRPAASGKLVWARVRPLPLTEAMQRQPGRPAGG